MVERLLYDDNAACFIDPDFCVESIACDGVMRWSSSSRSNGIAPVLPCGPLRNDCYSATALRQELAMIVTINVKL